MSYEDQEPIHIILRYQKLRVMSRLKDDSKEMNLESLDKEVFRPDLFLSV